MEAERLVVCDGHNIAYRSFFAIRGLANSEGEPTNAVYGFVRQMDRIKANLEPDALAVVFDGGIPERRLNLLETYKSQRPPMPGELHTQFETIGRYLKSANISSLRIDAEEADDVMATVATRAVSERGMDVLLATSDKDMYQLVDSHIRICEPKGENAILDSRGVADKTGVEPDKIVDWLALVGDTADNIPGISGVGPKTAAKLIAEFGSLEGIYRNIQRVKSAKVREKLLAGRDLLERNVALMELDTDVPVDVCWQDLRIKPPDFRELTAFFREMEFKKMLEELQEPRLF